MDWPAVVYCEKAGCGRMIKPSLDQFSVVSVQGNVEKQKGTSRGYYENEEFAVCKACTKKLVSMFKIRNDYHAKI